MIRIKFIPNILSQEGRKEFEFKFDRNLSIKDYLKLSNFKLDGWKVIVSGKRTDNLNQPIDNDDEIIITPDVKFEAVGAFLYWAFVTHWSTTLVVLATVATTIVSLTMAQGTRTPSFGNFEAEGIDESSPTYGWEGIQSTQEVGIPIKVIYGEHKIGGNIINQYISTDGDKNYLNVLLALCEGEIESISQIKINDQLYSNFQGVTADTRLGTNTQAVLPNFEDLHNTYNVNVGLTQNNPHIYTTNGSNIEGFDILLTFPSGIFQQDKNDGAILNWEVSYRVEYKLSTSGTWIDLGIITVSGKSRTAIRRIFSKRGLSPGQYDIRVTRTSENSSLDPLKTGDLTWTSIDEIVTDDLGYPNTALLGIKALATEQLSGSIPNITCVVKGRKVNIPKIMYGSAEVNWEDYYWDDATSQWKRFSDNAVCSWDGLTYVDRWCANPVWCLKDLLTNTRYGLGEFISIANINTAQFLEMAKYCETKVSDGAGGYEKRFRLDVVLDSSTKALDMILQICATFRAFPFYSNDAISLVIDKIGSPVQLFGMGNIIKDSFQQSWKSIKEVPNVVEVQFLDKDLDYQQETIAVIDEIALANGDPMRKKQIKLFVTRKSYAIREGKFALLVSKYLNRSISFRAGIDAIACQAGDIISIAHDVPQWGFSGRVQSGSTTTKVKLDQTVVIEAGKTYHIAVKFADDTLEERTISDSPGSYIEVNVSSAFSQMPQTYDIYSFGEINKVKKDFRVLGIRRENKGEVEIVALEYNSNIYDTETIIIPTNNYSALNSDFPDVTNLSLTERMVKLADGTIENVIDVWFQKPNIISYYIKQYAKAKIYLSEDSGVSWIYRGETYTEHFAIQGGLKDLRTYRVAVVTVADNGQENTIADSPYANIQILGKHLPPEDVDGFSVRQDGDEIVFSWSPNPDIDLFGYEIRQGDDWDKGTVIETNIQHTTYRMPIFLFGSQEYHIKAIDTSRNYSLNAASATFTISNANLIEDKGSYNLDNWANGTLDLSANNLEDVIDENNNLVVDEDLIQVESNYLPGFVIDNNIIDEQVIDESGKYVVDESNILVTENIDYPDLLALQLFGDHYATEGIYISPVQDLTSKMKTRILVTTQTKGNCSYSLYIRTSDDNITWSSWVVFADGEFICRYFQIKIILTNLDTSKICYVVNLKAFVTVQLIFEKFNNQTISIGGTDLVFTKAFLTLVNVFITAQGANRRAVYTSKSLAQITGVKVLDNSDVDVGGTVDCLVQGY